jgi:hypothetical protein
VLASNHGAEGREGGRVRRMKKGGDEKGEKGGEEG